MQYWSPRITRMVETRGTDTDTKLWNTVYHLAQQSLPYHQHIDWAAVVAVFDEVVDDPDHGGPYEASVAHASIDTAHRAVGALLERYKPYMADDRTIFSPLRVVLAYLTLALLRRYPEYSDYITASHDKHFSSTRWRWT